MRDELKKKIEDESLRIVLHQGSGGVFDVTVDGELVYSKDETGTFPKTREILKRLKS